MAALSGATQLTPLFPTYVEREILTSLTLTVVFAVYVVGALGMMWLGGSLSRKFGRRRLLGLALAAILLADIAFYYAAGLPLLMLGRFLSGAGVGVFVAIGSLALIDQLGEDRAEAGALLAACANVGGLAIGSVLAGFVAESASEPLHIPFLVHLAMIVAAFAALMLSAETIDNDTDRALDYSFPSIPDEARSVFVPSAIAAFAAFSVGGFFGAFIPSFASQELGISDALAIGVIAALVFASTVFGNVVATKLPERYAPLIGAVILFIGAAVLGTGLALVSLPVLVIGALIAGQGNGIALQSGLNAIKRESGDDNETEAVTLFFMIAYSALALPILLAGAVQQVFSLKATAVGFAVGIALMVAVAIVLLWRRLGESG
ncbi:MAG: MFS transporter [Erythrobacter sp.]|nr:MFS transporter [Erythrobacter sp.]